MEKNKEKKLSKALSYWLRHNPDEIGINLSVNGWTDVDELMEKSKVKIDFNIDELKYVVENNDKQRFSLREVEGFYSIRANQGHTYKNINLEFKEIVPPQILFHGAPIGVVDKIMKEGLKKMKRHFVHLSEDEDTAAAVGSRRGEFKILKIEAMRLMADGYKIFISDNGVYLVDEVPPKYIIN